MPDRFPSNSVAEQYEETAEIIYRNRMDKETKKLQKYLSPDSTEYDGILQGYSIAITDGLYAMMKVAEDLDVPWYLVEDEFIIKVNVIKPNIKKQLLKAYHDAFGATLKALDISPIK